MIHNHYSGRLAKKKNVEKISDALSFLALTVLPFTISCDQFQAGNSKRKPVAVFVLCSITKCICICISIWSLAVFAISRDQFEARSRIGAHFGRKTGGTPPKCIFPIFLLDNLTKLRRHMCNAPLIEWISI